MLQTLVVTLREGIEIALVMGIILAYLKRIGRPELVRWAWGGFGAALLPSLAGALWLQDLFRYLQVSEEVYEGSVRLIAAVFVTTMMVWMWRAGKQLKGRMEGRMAQLSRAGAVGWGVAGFAFLTVFREGVELLLFVKGLAPTSASFQQIEGFLLGVGLAALFGAAFLRGTVRINLAKFFGVTTALLAFLVLQLVVGGIHEFSEAGWLPSSKAEMAVIGPIVNDTGGHLYLFAAVLLVALLWVALTPGSAAAPALAPANPAEERKVRAAARAETTWRLALAGLTLFGAVFLIACSFHFAPPARAAAELLAPAVAGTVRIPLPAVEDGKLHFYRAASGATEIRFLALKLDDRRVSVALDACQICGPEGYFQDENQVICRHCGAPVEASTIGEVGGCNPIKVEAQVKDGFVVVRLSDLEQACEHVNK